MMNSVTNKNSLNLEDFKKWLDNNPAVRRIVNDAIRPTLWTILSDEKPVTKYNPKEARAGTFHTRILQDYGSRSHFSTEDEHLDGSNRAPSQSMSSMSRSLIA
jgi:hypothetical protein